jgi:eight-cysteine-cluster-containing protein
MNFVAPLLTSFGIFTLFTFYLYVQYGFVDLYILNKATGETTLFILGLVLLVGVLTRMYDVFDGFLKYRKYFGILAFTYALSHFLISYFLLPDYFPRTRFTLTNIPFLLGLVPVLILFVLTVFSINLFIRLLDRKIWWKFQNWGVRLGAILGFLHVVIMKDKVWWDWLVGASQDPMQLLPPLGLAVAIFFTFVLLVRLSEFLGKSIARIIIILLFFLLITAESNIFFENVTYAGKKKSAISTPPIVADYFVSSTYAACQTEGECKVSGCNGEICQGMGEEEMVSICVVPDKSTPRQLGLECGCRNSQCQWK